jgi:hypothetical protein
MGRRLEAGSVQNSASSEKIAEQPPKQPLDQNKNGSHLRLPRILLILF